MAPLGGAMCFFVLFCFQLFGVTFLPVTFIFKFIRHLRKSGLDEVSNKFQGLSSSDSNLEGLLKP